MGKYERYIVWAFILVLSITVVINFRTNREDNRRINLTARAGKLAAQGGIITLEMVRTNQEIIKALMSKIDPGYYDCPEIGDCPQTETGMETNIRW
ncbi:MAG: hypothetical protein ACXABY_35665 [Candidatus Thorarchaeota archaeon]|jgi:hypothetical protein